MYSKLLIFGVQVIIFLNMKPISEYKDYHLYIQEYYEERKQKSAFTWRDFASQAGFASPVFLKDVSTGKKNLGAAAVERVANAMGLVDFEKAYFRALVAFNQAKNDTDRNSALDSMRDIANAHKVKILGADEFAYFDSWKNPVIREIAPAMPGAKPLDMARACKQKISAAEVSETLQFLTRTGMLQKDDQGNYSQTEKAISSGDSSIVPLAVRNMHRQMGTFALDALDNVPVEERQFSGLTLGVPEDAYEKILKELALCRKRIMAIASESNKTEKVYRVNMQVFPLTESLKQCGGDR